LCRDFSDVAIRLIQPLEWLDTIHDGLETWGSVVEKKEKKIQKKNANPVASTSRTDPSLV
jgi:hypothetical protein